MVVKVHTFDLVRAPLRKGVSLVEASAGTGKTYTIAMLVMRAVVELDISIDKILVVTFTKAASEELRSRIRARLVEARKLLGGFQQLADTALSDWIAGLKEPEIALKRLKLALYDIDRAGIFTIHSFCQRMLVDQALESGQLFDVDLLADISGLRQQVAEDFWRKHIYSLAPLPCSILLEEFANPFDLLKSVLGGIRAGARIEPQTGSIEDALAALELGFTGMSCWWDKNGRQLLCQLREIKENKGFKKALTESFDSWGQSLDDFFSGSLNLVPSDLHLLLADNLIAELNGTKYRGEAKKQALIEKFNLPGDEIDSLLGAMRKLNLTVRVRLATEMHAELEKRLNLLGKMSFNDLISRLSSSLKKEQGGQLRSIIRQRFRLAMIDEFQDTDSSQYYIFSQLFDAASHYLYLIGDPKQAIYKFRGADIHSYFQARSQVDHFLTLDKNYRSHPFLVSEVNNIFSCRSRPFFFPEDLIDFTPVQPAKSFEDIDLRLAGKSLAGMVHCLLPENIADKTGRWTSGKAAIEFKQFVVAEITRLLAPGKVVVQKNKEQDKELRPRDIAILVRSNRQATEYLQTLNQVGIPAVVASRDSVFNSEECRELFTLLQAVSQPGNISYLKTAMTLRWFGLNGAELVDIWQDEEELNLWHERFLIYGSHWQKEGFMVMMNRLITAEKVYLKLASGQGTERSITNIQHLLELVQEAETSEHFQIGQTMLWLRRMIADESGAETHELRLESDEEAVRIITMHGAKGLEYPVVFCPFLWYRSNRLKREKYCMVSHDDDHKLVVDLGSEKFEQRREEAIDEEVAEDLRLLYVALTRATMRCYMMWADIKAAGIVAQSFDSALGYLLFPEGKCSAKLQQEKFAELTSQPSASLVTLPPGQVPAPFNWLENADDLQPLQASGRNMHTDWQMSSYSALASLSEHEDEFKPNGQRAQKEQGETRQIPVSGLPAGPHFGNVVHEILESIAFNELAVSWDHEELLQKKCRKYSVEIEPQPLLQLLKNVVTTPLAGSMADGGFSLDMLPQTSYLTEMEFYFRMGRLETEMINTVLAGEPTVCSLSHRGMQGYLTGLIDLVCEHRGRYYILDYKTNYLGDNMVDYEPQRLIPAMRAHNYGLQLWIYTLVLHRHLKNVLPGYSYAEHFGGVFYLFVRGMAADAVGNGVFSTVPALQLVEELDRILGGQDGQ